MNLWNSLCYSQNVFPADGDIVERVAKIAEHFNRVGDSLAFPAPNPFPLGLWLDSASTAALADPVKLRALRRVLDANGNVVFTLNAFPYGGFHGKRVKEKVYLPDWSSTERLEYTLRAADILAELLPPGMTGSISTLPGGYGRGKVGREEYPISNDQFSILNEEGEKRKGLMARNSTAQGKALGGRGGDGEMVEDEGTGRADGPKFHSPRCSPRVEWLGAVAANLRSVAEYLAAILAEKGVKIVLAVEMEPDCLWESPAEFIEFRNEFLLGHPAEEFIGVCYDTCHQELLETQPGDGLKLLEASGVPMPKIHLSAALSRGIRGIADAESAFSGLAGFADGVYLHQTRVFDDNERMIVRRDDIPSPPFPILTLADSFKLVSHFHIPIHLGNLFDGFSAAKAELEVVAAMFSKRKSDDIPHLEIETYTYDVLPRELRGASLRESMASEYEWVVEHFSQSDVSHKANEDVNGETPEADSRGPGG